MRYFRSQHGAMVHQEGCPTQPPKPIWWNWADDKTPEQIIAESAAHGIRHRWCKHCFKGYFPDLNNRVAV